MFPLQITAGIICDTDSVRERGQEKKTNLYLPVELLKALTFKISTTLTLMQDIREKL